MGSDAPHTLLTSGAPRRALRAFVLIPRPVRRCRTGSGAQSLRSARWRASRIASRRRAEVALWRATKAEGDPQPDAAPRICFWFFPVLACIAEQSPMSRHTTGDPDEGARDNVKCIIPTVSSSIGA